MILTPWLRQRLEFLLMGSPFARGGGGPPTVAQYFDGVADAPSNYVPGVREWGAAHESLHAQV
ncbi:MAG: hypothetical protein PVS2B3_01770 [Steroidobacteraceae bacterium]